MNTDINKLNLIRALKLGLIDWHQFFKMWQALPVIAIALILSACGGSGGGSAAAPAPADPNQVTCATLQGRYSNDMSAGETLDISGSCTFTDSICGYGATYTVPDRVTGATIITIQSTNGTPGCMSSTAHTCEMEYNGHQLGVNCDNGAHIYLFTKQ